MKKVTVLFAAVIVAVSLFASSCDSKRNVSLKKGIDSVSYAIGLANGDGFRQGLETFPGGEPIDINALIAGFEQGLRNDTSAYKMDPMAAQQYIQTYVMEAQAREAQAGREEGEKFLEQNKTKPGVITTESGLQYQVITEGDGPRPTDADRVKVYYTGTLLDGTEFDSSAKHGGEPSVFGVTQVIRGWTEGLKIMPVGSKYIFWIPSELAYGDRAAGQDIKPNSVLQFEVELLEIVE